MLPAAPFKRTRSGDRFAHLDVLRGFALLGILFVNLTWFSGWAVLGVAEPAAYEPNACDRRASALIHFIVEGKFYTLFSILFGIGFALVEQRCVERGVPLRPFFVRRMLALFMIGIAHATLIWFGDIVSLYAVTGLALLLFTRRSDRTVCIAGITLLASPLVLYPIWFWIPAGEPGYGPASLLPVFGKGTWCEIIRANWSFLMERWWLALYSLRFPKLLGAFLVGLWLVRRGIVTRPRAHRRLLGRLLALGLLVGIPANLWLGGLISAIPERPPSLHVWLRYSVDALALPTLTLAYLAAILLISMSTWGERVLAPLAYPGRLSLTNYVSQSIVAVALFYGIGLGHWGELGAARLCLVAAGIFVFLTLLSWLWLKCFRQGPLEWIWRRLAYGRELAVP